MTYSQYVHPGTPTGPDPWLSTVGARRGKLLGLVLIFPKVILFNIFHYCPGDLLQNNQAVGKPLTGAGKTKGRNISISQYAKFTSHFFFHVLAVLAEDTATPTTPHPQFFMLLVTTQHKWHFCKSSPDCLLHLGLTTSSIHLIIFNIIIMYH